MNNDFPLKKIGTNDLMTLRISQELIGVSVNVQVRIG
jgi:hypothetical protein